MTNLVQWIAVISCIERKGFSKEVSCSSEAESQKSCATVTRQTISCRTWRDIGMIYAYTPSTRRILLWLRILSPSSVENDARRSEPRSRLPTCSMAWFQPSGLGVTSRLVTRAKSQWTTSNQDGDIMVGGPASSKGAFAWKWRCHN